MAQTVATPNDSGQRPLAKRIKGALGKIVGKKIIATSSDCLSGPHWRQSINIVLSNLRVSDGHCESVQRNIPEITHGTSKLLDLPKELRHLIEENLPRADAVCLRQTCQKLQHESKWPVAVSDLSARQLYSLRKRLDRECFSILCALEDDNKLGNHTAACSFCLSLHEKKKFPTYQLKLPPQERVCTAVSKRYLICGHYWTQPAVLRLALEDVLATGRDQFPIHHWMPRKAPNQFPEKAHIVLSRAIENNNRLYERRSNIFVEDTGLAVEHHFHLQSQSTTLPIGWNFAAALANPQKGIIPTCPHLTIQGAGIRLGIQDAVADQYTECCPDQACKTDFGWFECASDTLGWEDLCFRVVRRFGWLENITDAFWRSQ